jgi:methyl-accepting chemotaxis protein
MGIRGKMLMGFLILVFMLFASGALSVFELTKLGRTVKGLITDNYKSIAYSKAMLEALEVQEKSVLVYISSSDKLNVEVFTQSHNLAQLYLDSAKMNLTVSNEKLYIDSIAKSYKVFNSSTLSFIESDSVNLARYLNLVHPRYIEVTHHVKQLMTINQSALYSTAAYLEASAQRVVMPGLIVILTSIIFTLVFIYLVNHFFVSPIIKLTKGINDFVKFQKPFDVPLETKDELSSLKESIVNLISLWRSGVKKKAEF